MEKLKVGFYGISGCAGCLLTVLYEDCFKEITKMVDIKAFPFIKEDTYKGKFDYVFIEGTVCFDRDIETIKKLRKRTKKLVALGTCACFGCVPSIRNFQDKEKVMSFVYPKHNHLNDEDPTPINKHIKVDFHIPQCPPDKEEIVRFIKCIVSGKEFAPYESRVCRECVDKGNRCVLVRDGKVCLGPITTGGCDALCPTNKTPCYGCRGPCKDARYEAFFNLLKRRGHTNKAIKDKLETFAGLDFKEQEGESAKLLEK